MREFLEQRIRFILEHAYCGLDATVRCRIARIFILQAAALALALATTPSTMGHTSHYSG